MIIYDDGRHRQSVYDMWERNFHDPVSYADFYFSQVYGKNTVLLLEEEDRLKGMLHWNPYLLRVKGKDIRASYIVGVATDEIYRRQGVMRRLLRETFVGLRKKGQPFTYLMPADENYYLPFDFRFGMKQLSQEIYCRQDAVPLPDSYKNWDFDRVPVEETLEEICLLENRERDKIYDIHTKITPDYLRRLEREAQSDFARMVYIYEERGLYVGRCVIGAENRSLNLSQISCAQTGMRRELIEALLCYCENRYHYGQYRLILDESWRPVLKALRRQGGYRMPPVKEEPIIMFRILDLPGMGGFIASRKETRVWLRVADEQIPEQNGVYLWRTSAEGSVIEKREEKTGEFMDAGAISIGELTRILFGGVSETAPENPAMLTGEGRRWIQNLLPLKSGCIMEIV